MKKNIVIVGASSGIGLECARLLVQNGDAVVNIARGACPLPEVKNLSADVTDPDRLQAAFAEVRTAMPDVDVLLYFAGYSMAAPLQYARREDWEYLYRVNLFGAIDCVQRVLPMMKSNGGKILFASSIGSVFPILFDAFYSSSKAALDCLAADLRAELKPFGIDVTSVRVNATATHFTFKRNVYAPDACGEYAAAVKVAAGNLADLEQNGAKPRDAAKEIVALTQKSNPPYRVALGLSGKIGVVLSRLLPDCLFYPLNARVQKLR